MKGLLLKDWYMMKKYMRSYLVLLVVFVVISLGNSDNMFFVFYPSLLSAMIPVSLMAYDERSKWDAYSGTLPCTKAQIVSVKYVLGVLLQALIILLTAIVQGIQMVRTGSFDWSSYLALVQMLTVMGCVALSVTLPFMYKYGVEKGRMAYYLMVVFVSGGSAIAATLFRDWLQMEAAADLPLALLTLAAMGVYALSWRLSIRFYEKRELK
ncbi:MAG: ABC-2 transporter permease [Oscillospiraceae bacterium]|nr:ABC-2 transporter permease [Oscillospiraceae bacterium]